MTLKWQRVYRLQVETTPMSGIFTELNLPFTCEFNITHSTNSQLNSAHFTVYNLSPFTRRKIFQDKFRLDDENFRMVIFSAGYGQPKQAGIVFMGNLWEAWSVREGVDVKTEMEAIDMLYSVTNGVSNICFPAGATQQQVFRRLCADLPTSDTPFISPKFVGVYDRGLTIEGNTWDKLMELIGRTGQVYLYQNHPVIMKDDDVLSSPVMVINGESGLLDSPKRQEGLIEIKTLFEPTIKLGALIQLESMETINNGQYKVMGYTHSGTISESVCGDATTNISLFIGSERLSQ